MPHDWVRSLLDLPSWARPQLCSAISQDHSLGSVAKQDYRLYSVIGWYFRPGFKATIVSLFELPGFTGLEVILTAGLLSLGYWLGSLVKQGHKMGCTVAQIFWPVFLVMLDWRLYLSIVGWDC